MTNAKVICGAREAYVGARCGGKEIREATKEELLEAITCRAEEVDKGVGAVRILGCVKIGEPRTAETDFKEMRAGIGAALRSCDAWAETPKAFISI